uniref:RING-type domain-containing protein n=1 Tax=Gouania willdenowi TaxID=441366 RepID=A0A8C5GXD2_GOUWI
MALNIQSSTLSLTLPISCQICLGKVRQPVICDNHHVFCSSCMEMWLKKASQCPTCRVSITVENPCREIIGGTNEGDHSDNPSMRKCLRKTRGELLLREYEDEIEGLMKENEELKNKSQSLEAQLKTALDPCSMSTVQLDDKSVSAVVLEEWTNKLRAATDACDKIKQDMDKLKEANTALRSQNVDLVRENMRLKAEVASRSPQKFGRFTVAALEAKIQQYERDVSQLKRALERSDQYIDDLESRITKSEKKSPEAKEVCGKSKTAAETLTQQQKISMMMRSLSDNERELICSNPEAECPTFARNPSAVEHHKQDNSESTSSDFLPSTPSDAFRSLTLRSPGIREKKVAFKTGSHLRKLDFDATPESTWPTSKAENPFSCFQRFPTSFPANFVEWSSLALWGTLQRPIFFDPSGPGPSWQGLHLKASSSDLREEDVETKMSSEASMNAAYHNKVSELASMMQEGEGSLGMGSHISLPSSPPELENTPSPDAQTCPDVLTNVGGHLIQYTPNNQPPCDIVGGILSNDKSPKCSAEDGFANLVLGTRLGGGCAGRTESPQSDEMSFDLLFDPLDENKADAPACLSSAGHDYSHPVSSSSNWTGADPVNTRERNVKRKSYSPFTAGSPTKLSKLM